jgi:hypothetical protein
MYLGANTLSGSILTKNLPHETYAKNSALRTSLATLWGWEMGAEKFIDLIR